MDPVIHLNYKIDKEQLLKQTFLTRRTNTKVAYLASVPLVAIQTHEKPVSKKEHKPHENIPGLGSLWSK